MPLIAVITTSSMTASFITHFFKFCIIKINTTFVLLFHAMCGILGYVGQNEVKEKFELALERLKHRGPDAEGLWAGKNILLGHRRLAIIDLSENAAQPMVVFNRYVITLNGEIYNYKELRDELKRDFNFRSESDTEVLLYSYIKWGTDCVNKFNGMWAFAIWDDERKELFLSRDRIGKKPLFYSFLPNGDFVFASEMKAIYPFLPLVEFDYETIDLAQKNNFSYESTERCLIKGIKRFPAGSNGIYKNNTLYINKYWEPFKEKMEVPKSYPEQVELFRSLFLDACKIRMRADVTIGTALSGGIDSSSVICAMNYISKNQSIHHDWQHAFVACFPNTSLDETEYAKAVTDYLNIKADFIEIDPIKELDNLYLQAYLFEEIYYAPTIPFVQLYRNIKQKGVTVSIDGHGADELFCGYNFDIPPAIIDAYPNLCRMKAISATYSNCFNPPKYEYFNHFKYVLVNKYPFLRKFAKSTPIEKKVDRWDYLNSRLYESTYITILPTLLRNYDRYSMMNGVEIRMPFLDYRILQFAFSIPYSSKIRKGYTKAIVRDAMQGILPEKIQKRKTKIGFNSPIDSWAKNSEFRQWLGDTVNSKEFETATTINPIKTRQSINQLLSTDELNFFNSSALFNEIIPYIWEMGIRRYGI